MKPLEAAQLYTQRGCSVIPVPHLSKNPGRVGWQNLRLVESELHRHFNGRPQNIGVLLGEASGGLVDVDLDHPLCVELAPRFLPPTPAVFGRASKRRSHWIYRVNEPVQTKQHQCASAGSLVELRSTGLQTVFPPSTHPSGESIEWEDPNAEPAIISGVRLHEAVEALAQAARRQLDEILPEMGPVLIANEVEAADRCLAALMRLRRSDRKDGSRRLLAVACRAVEHGLGDQDAIRVIRRYATQFPFPTDWSDQQIIARLRDAEKKLSSASDPIDQSDARPAIRIAADEHRVICQTITALVADPDLFHRGGALVRIRRERAPEDGIIRSSGSATIDLMPQACLRERMTRYARFTKAGTKRRDAVELPAHPTPWLVAGVHSRGDWPELRQLSGISETPVLRADGTLFQTPGYDSQSGILFEPTSTFPPISESATREDAVSAVSALLEVVCDFRFASPAHRAAWLAALLTPLARFAFAGPSPLFLVDANVRGAGKGLLVQAISQIVLGREMPVSSYAHDPSEMRKKITSIALAGDRVVHLDNVEGTFGNEALDRALTSTFWKDRILGGNQEVELPLIPVWYGTGNNVAIASDTARRIVHIRLDVLHERPEERHGFVHADLLDWIHSQRPRLLCAALTILTAYGHAGRPSGGVTPFGSFEGWSRLVREALVWTGQPDPCSTRRAMAVAGDVLMESLQQLIEAWRVFDPDRRGIVLSELIDQFESHPTSPEHPSAVLRMALLNLMGGSGTSGLDARKVGNKLRSLRRRVVSGHYLDVDPNGSRRHGALWRLYPAEVSPAVSV